MVRWSRVAVSLVAFIVLSSVLLAQEPGRNRLYVDAFGPGIVYSLNYERQVTGPLSLRVGGGGWPQDGFEYLLGFGAAIVQVGSQQHAAILGLGGGVAWFADVDLLEETDVVGGYGIGILGYQFQPRPTGFFLRLTYTPFFNANAIAPLWGGASFGWVF